LHSIAITCYEPVMRFGLHHFSSRSYKDRIRVKVLLVSCDAFVNALFSFCCVCVSVCLI